VSDSIQETPCLLCGGATEAVSYTSQVQSYYGRTLHGTRCRTCGMLRFPENTGTYKEQLSLGSRELALKELRNANEQRPGREFHMAQMAIEILGRPDAHVSFFGAGLNTDWKWLQRVHPKSRSTLVDLENMQDAAHFEHITQASPADIVIASEVIEHFEEPLAHFETLLRLVKDDGLLVCSTNVYDGTDISRHEYPFVHGHVSYWTPNALACVGRKTGYFVDFRTPKIAMSRGGPRKKYILFYRDVETTYKVGTYFGTQMFAPSEA